MAVEYVATGYVEVDYYQTGISVDWDDQIVFVPKIFMTLVQSTPTVIYDLDTDVFRLALKEKEASIIGMSFPDIHQTNAPVTVGGVQLARVIEIINGYTVTFEDDQYAVNLIGSNNNIGDNVNVNQVSVRSTNSAGLVQTSEIQFSSFQNVVTIDQANGTAGQAYPIGTVETPVNNLTDALFIAQFRGLDTFSIKGDFTFGASDTVDDYTFIGQGAAKTSITLTSAATITNCTFREASIDGELDGGTSLYECHIMSLNYIDGAVHDCAFEGGTVTLNGTKAEFVRCFSVVADGTVPVIDFAGNGTDLSFVEYRGDVEFRNRTTGTGDAAIGLDGGHVTLAASITAGTFDVYGTGELTDNSAGATVTTDNLLQAKQLNLATAILQNKTITDPTTGVMTVYAADGVTPLYTAQLYEDAAGGQTYKGSGAERRERLQ